MAEYETARRTIGYLCTYVPEEIMHAAGFLPVRILPSTEPATRADAHMQSYTCHLARNCLDQALAGKLNSHAGVVFAHTCDTMQGLADIWSETFTTVFVDTVVTPVALNSPHAHAYLAAELRRFARALEQHFGIAISDEALRASIRVYNTRRRALADFYAQRASFTAVEWFNTMRGVLTTGKTQIPTGRFAVPNPYGTLRSPKSKIENRKLY